MEQGDGRVRSVRAILWKVRPYGNTFQDIRDLQHLEFPFDEPKLLSSGTRRTLSFRSKRHWTIWDSWIVGKKTSI